MKISGNSYKQTDMILQKECRFSYIYLILFESSSIIAQKAKGG